MDKSSNSNGGKRLRAASYCRTSGEDHTSIATQKGDNEGLCAANGWTFIKHYIDECKSGSKIEGRDAFQQMLRDAAAGLFDIIIVWDITRFSRNGLDILIEAERLKLEHNVDVIDTKGSFNADTEIINKFVHAGLAEHERRKIIERTTRGKLACARTGAPINRRRPYGRIWDGKAWSVDEGKRQLIRQIAARYIDGASLVHLAKLHNFTLSNLQHILREGAGAVWRRRITAKVLKINESIETPIPPLLDAETMAKVAARVEANKSWDHAQLKHKWLLGRVLFCAHCGSCLFGHQLPGRGRYYRHDRHTACPMRSMTCRADALEAAVYSELFLIFDNPAARRRAIEAAKPKDAHPPAVDVSAELGKVRQQKARLVKAIASGIIDDNDAAEQMRELKERERLLSVREAPAPQQNELPYSNAKLVALAQQATPESTSWEDRRELVKMVFSGKRDGKRAGVYISAVAGQGKRNKRWAYELKGHVVDGLVGATETGLKGEKGIPAW
jgi:DNA invertase Pin-like site-specific DNA recombinase